MPNTFLFIIKGRASFFNPWIPGVFWSAWDGRRGPIVIDIRCRALIYFLRLSTDPSKTAKPDMQERAFLPKGTAGPCLP
jgi:hypothetical protein